MESKRTRVDAHLFEYNRLLAWQRAAAVRIGGIEVEEIAGTRGNRDGGDRLERVRVVMLLDVAAKTLFNNRLRRRRKQPLYLLVV